MHAKVLEQSGHSLCEVWTTIAAEGPVKFIVLFEDALDAHPDIRKAYMAEHLEFLERHAGIVDAAGPLTDPDGAGRDGLWIVEAEDATAVEALVREDPFWPTGLRASFSVIPWRRVYSGGERLIEV